MKKNYRKTDKDFKYWCCIEYNNACQFADIYETSNDIMFIVENNDKYKHYKRVINSYNVLYLSLNNEQKLILEAIKNNTLHKIEYKTYDLKEVFDNWLFIWFSNNDNLLKELDCREIGINLRLLRIRNRYSIKALADLLDVDQSTIKKYELGYQFPRVDLMYKIAQLYKMTIDEIINIK